MSTYRIDGPNGQIEYRRSVAAAIESAAGMQWVDRAAAKAQLESGCIAHCVYGFSHTTIKRMERFTVTYDIVTPESAEHGDTEECGFVMPGQWKPLDPETQDDRDAVTMTLREAVDLIGGHALEDSGSWFTNFEYDDDYTTGGRESRSLHPPRNITPASYNRIARLLGLGD